MIDLLLVFWIAVSWKIPVLERWTFPWQDLGTKLIAAVQAGSPPDSSRVNNFALKMAVRASEESHEAVEVQ